MKKCLFVTIGLVLMLTSCASTNGLKKEKVDDGLIKYTDAVTETIRFEHPKLVPDVDGGKFNLHKGQDSENINAYIDNGQFFIEAAYECKSPNLLKINSIVFISGEEKVVFKKARLTPTDLELTDYSFEEFVNPYFSYSSVDNYSYEEFKMMLTEDEVDQLSNLLETGNTSVAFVGERGRTDLFKLNKKITVALRSMIEKYDYLLYGEPEPEVEETLEEDLDEYADEYYNTDEYSDVYATEYEYTDEYTLSDDYDSLIDEETYEEGTADDVLIDETSTEETTTDTASEEAALAEETTTDSTLTDEVL